MDQEKKQTKCNIHSKNNKNLLLFEQDNIHACICLTCAKNLSQNINKIIEIDEVLDADHNHIFSSFPLFEDQNIYKIIQNIQPKSTHLERIDIYFTWLKQKINQKIDLIKDQTKEKLISIEDENQFNAVEFFKDYNEISSKFDFQNIYKQFNENFEKKLQEIIKEKQQNIKQNTKNLLQHINNYNEITNIIELKQPMEIQSKILGLLDELNFINQQPINSIEKIELEKSKFSQSQSLVIQRLYNKSIQIQSTVEDFNVAYSNFVLDPMKRYIFRVRLQTNSSYDSYLLVDIIKEQNKDKGSLQNKICYNERGDMMTIDKVIKGNNVFEGSKYNIDKEIEVRIHLAEKMIRVANYPNYENVAELKDNSQIKDYTQYRFAVEI